MASLVALLYNWWHLAARLYDGAHSREAICASFWGGKKEAPSPLRSGSSRPALLCGVGRLIRHSGQSTIKVSLQHEKSDLLVAAITQVSNTLQRFWSKAERWTQPQRWILLLTHIFRHWLGGKWLGELPSAAEPLLSG